MEYFTHYDYTVKYLNIYRNKRNIVVEKEYICYLYENIIHYM